MSLIVLFKYYEKNKLKICEEWNARYIGEILLNIDDHHISDAEEWIKKAIEADERNGLRCFLADDYVFYSELYKRKGYKSKAKEILD